MPGFAVGGGCPENCVVKQVCHGTDSIGCTYSNLGSVAQSPDVAS